MKAYKGFEAKKTSGGVQLPAAGAYIGEIQGVKVEPCQFENDREQLVLMLEITEGDCKGRYHEVFQSQQERFGGDVKYKGSLRIKVPKDTDGEEDAWIRRVFNEAMWCVQESNDGYTWDWDESKLKGKKVGFSVRDTYYTVNKQDRQSTEIGRLEAIPEVREGKVRPMRPRDNRKEQDDSTDGESFTDVSKEVEVPF